MPLNRRLVLINEPSKNRGGVTHEVVRQEQRFSQDFQKLNCLHKTIIGCK